MRITLIIFLLTLQSGLSYSLQGRWMLTSMGYTLSVPTQIKEVVYQQTQIINELKLLTCNTLKYQFNIDQTNIWIDALSQSIDQSANCLDSDAIMLQDIRKAIRTAFTFQILGQHLIIYDTTSNPVLIFKREVNKANNEIKGSWITTINIDDATTYLLIADESTISVCNTVFKYVIESPYSISLKLQSQPSCQNSDVVSSLLKASYFRKHNGKLRIYDSRVAQLAEARYRSNQTLVPQAPSVVPSIPTTFGAGNYILLLLFRRDLMRVKVQITTQSIKMTICTQLTFTYNLLPSSTISIKGTNAPNANCKKADETIYYNYLTSANSYSIDTDGVITLNDSSNKGIVSLAQ